MKYLLEIWPKMQCQTNLIVRMKFLNCIWLIIFFIQLHQLGVRCIWGSLSTINEYYPFFVFISLEYPDGSHLICSGTLVKVRWVLTSPDCVNYKGVQANEIKVWVAGHRPGNLFILDPFVEFSKAIHFHPSYKRGSIKWDLALVYLKHGMLLLEDRVWPVELPCDEKEASGETNGTLLGSGVCWGICHYGALQKAFLSFRNASECWDLLSPADKAVYTNESLAEDIICAGGEDGVPCYGDSGGPLLFRPSIYGPLEIMAVTAFLDIFSSCVPRPRIFLKLRQHHLDWIQNKTYLPLG